MTDRSPITQGHSDPEKHRRLVESAAEAFARFGFDRAAIDDIAARAGVGKGTVYLYFANKAALFHAVLAEVRVRLSAAAPPERDDPAAELRRLVRGYLHLAHDAPDLFRCYASALFGVNRTFQDAALEIFAWQQQRLRALLAATAPADAPDGGYGIDTRTAMLTGAVLAAGLIRHPSLGAAAEDAVVERVLLDILLADLPSGTQP